MYVLIVSLVNTLSVFRNSRFRFSSFSVFFREFVICGIFFVFFGGRLYRFLFMVSFGWILFLILLRSVISRVVKYRYGLVVGFGKRISIRRVFGEEIIGIRIDVERLRVE